MTLKLVMLGAKHLACSSPTPAGLFSILTALWLVERRRMSKKRRREQSSIDVQLVEIYEDLANQNEEIRLKAAHAFLTKFSPDNRQSSDRLAEAVRRLLRGLCSGRKAARLGFSIALTELLSQRWGEPSVSGADELRLSDLIDVLIKQTETSGKVSGQVRYGVFSTNESFPIHKSLGRKRSPFWPFVWRRSIHKVQCTFSARCIRRKLVSGA